MQDVDLGDYIVIPCRDNITIEAGDHRVIATVIQVKLPQGIYCIIRKLGHPRPGQLLVGKTRLTSQEETFFLY